MTNRELDNFISTRIFGKRVQVDENGVWEWVDSDGFWDVVPFYSSDITDAMRVMEHLRNSGKYCCLEIHSDYNYNWTVCLTLEDLRPVEEIILETAHKPFVHVRDESLPRAICLAAFKTLEVNSDGLSV